MFNKLTAVLLLLFSFSLNADVVKWVDSEGKTHYSNKAPKKIKKTSKKLKFVTYKKPDKKTEITAVPITFKKAEDDSNLDKPKTIRKKPVKPINLTISELKVRCELAREKRIAPVREEEIEKCVEKQEDRNSRPQEYCERQYRYFGNGERNGYGRSLRLFHNIPECRRLYSAEDKRSRLNRGYSD